MLMLLVCLMVIPEALFQEEKPPNVTFISLTWSENAKPCDFTKLRVIGRESLVNGTFEILEDIEDEHYKFACDYYSDLDRDGNFKLLPLVSLPPQGICTVVKEYGHYLADSIRYPINTDLFVNESACTIPKGVYFLKDAAFNVDRWFYSSGIMRFVGKFFKDGELIGSYNITVSID
ncbi:uncharacterized protein [Drosophila takahashii]|uniref:uncharacterized protein n=1 Tax=Drosophila takahashii TaxID=29030 RepID=UPI001CF8FC3B|nr:uncharacterized protein LOC108055602 [Drosophila takahashii]